MTWRMRWLPADIARDAVLYQQYTPGGMGLAEFDEPFTDAEVG
jgi:hypothetical protein